MAKTMVVPIIHTHLLPTVISVPPAIFLSVNDLGGKSAWQTSSNAMATWTAIMQKMNYPPNAMNACPGTFSSVKDQARKYAWESNLSATALWIAQMIYQTN